MSLESKIIPFPTSNGGTEAVSTATIPAKETTSLLQFPQSEQSPANDQQREFAAFLGTVIAIRDAVDSYAYWKCLKMGLPRNEIRREGVFKDLRKDSLEAVYSLHENLADQPENNSLVLSEFRRNFGETGDEYIDVYTKAKRHATENAGDADALAGGFASILKDKSISLAMKKTLIKQAFSQANMTKKEVAKLSAKLVGAAGATALFAATAEPAAIAASAYGAAHPFLDGIAYPPQSLNDVKETALSLGVDASLVAGFYGATWLYAKQNIRMLRETGFGPNVFAATAYHVGNILQSEKARNRAVMGAVFGVNLAADIPYISTVVVPHSGPSMVAGVYTVGIAYTLAQSALSEPIIQFAKLRNRNKAEAPVQNTETEVFSSEIHHLQQPEIAEEIAEQVSTI